MVTGFGSQFSHDGQVRNRMFHLGYNFLVLAHLLIDELQTRETMMEFMEMENEANSDYVLTLSYLGFSEHSEPGGGAYFTPLLISLFLA